jgi:hypothetical protein
VTRHRDVLRCPRCRTTVATYDGLGTVDETTLSQWRDALDRHRPLCPNPAPPSVAPASGPTAAGRG